MTDEEIRAVREIAGAFGRSDAVQGLNPQAAGWLLWKLQRKDNLEAIAACVKAVREDEQHKFAAERDQLRAERDIARKDATEFGMMYNRVAAERDLSSWAADRTIAQRDQLRAENELLRHQRDERYADYEAGWNAAEYGQPREEGRTVAWLNGWEYYHCDEQNDALRAALRRAMGALEKVYVCSAAICSDCDTIARSLLADPAIAAAFGEAMTDEEERATAIIEMGMKRALVADRLTTERNELRERNEILAERAERLRTENDRMVEKICQLEQDLELTTRELESWQDAEHG